MGDWEYACRVAPDGQSELLQSLPEYKPRERNACVPVAPDASVSSIGLNARPDGGGAVMFVFTGNSMPSREEIEKAMSGFETWGIMTAQSPLIEMTGPAAESTFDVTLPGFEGTTEATGGVLSAGGSWGGAGGGALINSGWPYLYRALLNSDATTAGILAGDSILPRPPTSGIFQPAASRAEMTFRHLRPGGGGLFHGTDRISLGKDFKAIYKIAGNPNAPGTLVRVDPNLAQAEGAQFLHPAELNADLDVMERQILQELEAAQAAGAGKTKIAKINARLDGLARAREYVIKYQEVHVVSEVPGRAVSVAARSSWTEGAMRFGATGGLRVVGGVLIVYGAYKSVQRVREAAPCQRNRIATQEVGGWVGGLIGAWTVGKAFAFAGGVLGVETGPGAIVTGLAGGLLGGVIGGIGGALGADWVYSLMNDDSAAESCSIAHGVPPSQIQLQ